MWENHGKLGVEASQHGGLIWFDVEIGGLKRPKKSGISPQNVGFHHETIPMSRAKEGIDVPTNVGWMFESSEE